MADTRRPSPIPRGHAAAFLAFLQTCVVGVRRVLSTREALGGTSDKVLDLTDHPPPHPSAPLSSKASSQALQGRQRGGAPDGEHTPVAAGTSRPPPGVKRAKAKHTLVLRPRSDRFRVPAASPTPARPLPPFFLHPASSRSATRNPTFCPQLSCRPFCKSEPVFLGPHAATCGTGAGKAGRGRRPPKPSPEKKTIPVMGIMGKAVKNS